MTISILVPVSVFSSVQKRLVRLACECGVELVVNDGLTTMFRRDSDRKVDQSRAVECRRLTIGELPA